MSAAQRVSNGLAERVGADAPQLLEAYIPRDRRRALAVGADLPNRVHGAALFADISGFTSLTETLANELGPRRGAEEITFHLNRVLQALIGELERFGGDVIYFSGDAITCWIDGDDGSRATACALAMQVTMGELGEVATPAGARIRLAMKASVAVGAARRFVVGDPDIQLLDVLAGRLIDALAMGEQLARAGDVVLDESVVGALDGQVDIVEFREDAETHRRFGVAITLAASGVAVPETSPDVPLPVSLARPWLLPGVYERLAAGNREFLAELRPAFPLFVSFDGIDYDRDNDAAGKLDNFVRRVQHVLADYGGSLLNLTLGDKGAYLSAVFGPPFAHEDDGTRAAAAALELRDLGSRTAAQNIRIGVAHGRLRSGTCGGERRQTFTCLGDPVNLSARLMSKAAVGQILVSEPVRRLAGEQFEWEALTPVTVKGKTDPIAVFALIGMKRRAARQRRTTDYPMIGRKSELAALDAKLDEALAGRGRIVGVTADAGIGKSRLIAEFAQVAERRGVPTVRGECQSYGINTSYHVWRPIWSTFFGLDDGLSAEEQVRRVENGLAEVHPVLVHRAPLLAALLETRIPDNDLTAGFDAKLRKTSLEGLLVDCLRARARRTPLLLILEDCHWIDPLSRDLLVAIARSLSRDRVLLVLSYRPGAEIGGGLGLERMAQFDELALAELDGAAAATLIREKIAGMLGAAIEPPPGLVKLVTERAQGNPFYIEELLNYIAAQGLSLRNDAAMKNLELPDSLHALILSRIDKLDEGARQTLKVASVAGRVFRGRMLPEVYPGLGRFEEVSDHLHVLLANDLVAPDPATDQTYLFRHGVTREVTYESLPFAFRSMLHGRIGAHIEATEADAIASNLDLLAHHYGHSANLEKKREYLGRAGDAAQAAYANEVAIDYYERLAPLVEDGARVDVLLKLGKVLELVGNWRQAEEIHAEGLALAKSRSDARQRARCETALAEVARKQGRYDEAVGRLERAADDFGAVGDEDGLASVLHLAGTVATQRGDYEKGVESYERGLVIRRRTGDNVGMANLLTNLGVIAEYRGDYESSRGFHERALALGTEIGDRRSIGKSTTNLGMIAVLQRRYDEARDWFEKSMNLSREMGDPWMVAICHNNLGNATRGLGRYGEAGRHYANSIRAYRDYDDRWALAFLLEDIGVLAAMNGDPRSALEFIGAADTARDRIGAPRAPSLESEIASHVVAAVATISETEQQAWRARGRSQDLTATVERALQFCEFAAAV